MIALGDRFAKACPVFFILLLGFTQSGSVASVIEDGGLEQRDATWIRVNGAQWTGENPHGGETAADLSREEGDPPRLIMTRHLDWAPHSVYRTRFWARTTEGSGLVKVNFWAPADEEGKTHDGAHREVKIPNDGKWREFRVIHDIADAPAGTEMRLRIWTLSETQETYVDDVSVELLKTNKVYLDKESLICLSESDPEHAADPRIAVDENGDTWVSWISYTTDRDTVHVRRIGRSGQKPSPAIPIPLEGNACEQPLIAPVENGVIVVWIEITSDGRWVLRSSGWNGTTFAPPTEIWSGKGKAHNPFLASSPDGTAWLVWEVYGELSSKIYVSHFQNNVWHRPIGITSPAFRCYDPSVAVDPRNNTAWITYSRSEDGYSDVWLSQLNASDLKTRKKMRLTDSGWSFSPRLASDADGDLWVAWEEQVGAERPGKPKSIVGEVFDKRIHIGRFRNGVFLQPCAPATGEAVPVSSEGNSQRPALIPRTDGGIVLLSRVSEEPRRTWNIRANLIDPQGGRISAPVKVLLGVELGRKEECAAIPVGDTLRVTWQGDDYLTRRYGKVRSDVYLVDVPLKEMTTDAEWQVLEWKEMKPRGQKRPPITPEDQVRKTVAVGGETYTLYWGTLHEHTDYSRCAKGHDGSHDDNYRLNLEIDGCDFTAITDHGYDMDEVGWKRAKRFASFYNDPGFFVTFPAYEWTQTPAHNPVTEGYGHRNVFFASDKDAGEFCYNCFMEESDHIAELWDLLRGRNVITIPHHPADKVHPMDWCRDDELQPLVEIFQSRGSAEHVNAPRVTRNLTDRKGCYVHDALKRGFHMGFVASGDHGGPGLTGVYASDLTREGIMEALKSRRCFGTTEERIFVDFRIDGRLMGEQLTVPAGETLKISGRIRGTDALSEIVVFRNCEIFHRQSADDLRRRRSLTLSLKDTATDAAFYYLRVVQENEEIAWSSPIWVEPVERE